MLVVYLSRGMFIQQYSILLLSRGLQIHHIQNVKTLMKFLRLSQLFFMNCILFKFFSFSEEFVRIFAKLFFKTFFLPLPPLDKLSSMNLQPRAFAHPRKVFNLCLFVPKSFFFRVVLKEKSLLNLLRQHFTRFTIFFFRSFAASDSTFSIKVAITTIINKLLEECMEGKTEKMILLRKAFNYGFSHVLPPKKRQSFGEKFIA